MFNQYQRRKILPWLPCLELPALRCRLRPCRRKDSLLPQNRSIISGLSLTIALMLDWS